MEPIRVRLFASFADLFGESQIEVSLPRGSTVRDLTRALQALPAGVALPDQLVVAINHSYAEPGTIVSAADEVALIPPVAGG